MNDNRMLISMTLRPWPQTVSNKEVEKTADGIIGAFIFSIAMAFIPASLIVYTVREREELVKHQ